MEHTPIFPELEFLSLEEEWEPRARSISDQERERKRAPKFEHRLMPFICLKSHRVYTFHQGNIHSVR